MSKGLRREVALEMIGFLEARGVDVSKYKPDFPKSLLLTGLMMMFAEHEKTPFIDPEDLPFLEELMEKTYRESAEEVRRARERARLMV